MLRKHRLCLATGGSLASVALLSCLQFAPLVAQAAQPTADRVACQGTELIQLDSVDVKSLRSLIQRYGAFPGLDATIASQFGTMTRYEFAGVLSAEIDYLLERLSADKGFSLAKADLDTIKSLQQNYASELAVIRGRVDGLEVRTATLEKQQFSTTTKLSGEVIFGASESKSPAIAPFVNQPAAPAAPPPAANALPASKVTAPAGGVPVFSDRSRINPPGTGNTEGYNPITENPFLRPGTNPLSTFSIDVDTASYSNVRRFITQGQLPPKDAVRIEEMVNYFPYDYPQPTGDHPFSVTTDVATAPWNPQHKLVQIGLKGKQLQTVQPSNLVFLVDVSGSMDQPNKLPLVKQSLCLLVKQLSARDRVTLVVYAGNAGLVLPPTPGNEKEKIMAAIANLQAGGSTAGGAGIELAYKMAQQSLLPQGNNRVILATDGDFNVGASSDAELVRLIEQKRDRGIFLTVLGFGMGNYKDSKMEQLADKGNGNYAYIDSVVEAQKVLVNDLRGTLFAIAKDVKIQVEFNPAKVQAYRLIGYENRLLRDQDFNDDTKDAGEIGAGHTVTALYEIIPTGVRSDVTLPTVDPLKYQRPATATATPTDELMQVKLRYKAPTGSTSQLISQTVGDRAIAPEAASANLKFAAAVTMYAMLLSDSAHKGTANFEQVLQLANAAKGRDRFGYRAEFIRLVERSRALVAQQPAVKKATRNNERF